MTQQHGLSSIEGVGDPAELFSLLIVDDDEQILALLHDLLARERRYRISTAPDPREALALLRAGPFDLLITDYRMPEMTGLDLIREARHLHPDLMGILITGFAWPDAAAGVAEAGVYDLMLKPLNIGEVRVRVRNACERFRLVRENRRYQSELEQARAEGVRGVGLSPHALSGETEESSAPIAEIGLFPPTASSTSRGPKKEEQVLDQLERLGKLYQAGLLTKEEFSIRKARLLSRT